MEIRPYDDLLAPACAPSLAERRDAATALLARLNGGFNRAGFIPVTRLAKIRQVRPLRHVFSVGTAPEQILEAVLVAVDDLLGQEDVSRAQSKCRAAEIHGDVNLTWWEVVTLVFLPC